MHTGTKKQISEQYDVIKNIVYNAQTAIEEIAGLPVQLSVKILGQPLDSIVMEQTTNRLENLQRITQDYFGLQWEAIIAKNRRPPTVAARQCFLYLAYEDVGGVTLTDLAGKVKRDHTSVLYIINRVKDLLSVKDEQTMIMIKAVKEKLQQPTLPIIFFHQQSLI